MNTTSFYNCKSDFDVLDLKARFSFKTVTSVSFDMGRWSKTLRLPSGEGNREMIWSHDRDFVFNVVGWFDVHYPCDGHIKAHVRIRIPGEYHPFEKMKSVVEAIFKELDIPLDETYEANVFNDENETTIMQPIDRNGVTDENETAIMQPIDRDGMTDQFHL